jgi:rhamnosyltransferase
LQLAKQTFRDYELWNHDSCSDDGTLAVIAAHNIAERIITNNPSQYNPGRVLNEAVKLCRGEIIVFLNSDATPVDEHWLENLIAPLENPGVGAVYGRQVARPDCYTLFDKDTERAFGDGSVAANWRHFFSMANSATRRETATLFRFSTSIQYSEDIEWSLRLKESGYTIAYAAAAVACHSHNYSLAESYKRHKGEGKAEAVIFKGHDINFSLATYLLAPFCMEVLRDISWSIRNKSILALIHSIPLRAAQKLGRWVGARSAAAIMGDS